MNEWFTSTAVSEVVQGWPAVMGDAVLKGTALLVLATFLTTCLMRHRPAAERHLVWTSVFAVLLALPLLLWILPGWPMLPTWSSGSVVVKYDPGPVVASSTLAEPVPELMPEEIGAAGERLQVSGVSPSKMNERRVAATKSQSAFVFTSLREKLHHVDMAQLLLGLWLLGFLILGLRLCVSMVYLRRLGRHAEQDGGFRGELETLRRELGVTQRVRLLIGGSRQMPMAWGILRPRIIVPSGIGSWPASRRRVVLLHELGHVVRRDPFWQLLLEAARALYWFHPLVWFAAWQAQVERERACDNVVLNRGIEGVDYAGHLLELVVGQRLRYVAAAGVGTAAGRRVAARLRLILDDAQDRRPLTRWAGVLVLGTCCLLTGLAVVARAEVSEGGREPSGSVQGDVAEAGTGDEVALSAIAWRERPRTEADRIVAAARARSLGIEKRKRFVLRGTYWNADVVGMKKVPERSFENLLKARDGEADGTRRVDMGIALGWEASKLVLRSEMKLENGGELVSVRYWDGNQGWHGTWQRPGNEKKGFGRFSTLSDLMRHEAWSEHSYFRSLGPSLPWPGPALVLEHAPPDPSQTRYRRLRAEEVDGELCDVFEGPERHEIVWVGRTSGRLRSVYRRSLHRILPEYYTDLVREVAGRVFEDEREYADWWKKQPREVQAVVSAHWRAAHWSITEPSELLFFSDYREIGEGIEWPMKCERITAMSAGNTGSTMPGAYSAGNGYCYIRSEEVVDKVSLEASIKPLIVDTKPAKDDRVWDRRFDVPVEYYWDPNRSEVGIRVLIEEQQRAKASRKRLPANGR